MANPNNDPKIALYNSTSSPEPRHDEVHPRPRRAARLAALRPLARAAPRRRPFNMQPDNYLITPQQRISLYSAGDHQLGDLARAYFEASYVNRQSRSSSRPSRSPAARTTSTRPSRRTASTTPSASTSAPSTAACSSSATASTQIEINTVRGVAGLDGTLPDAAGPLQGWFWDLSFNYGRTTGCARSTGAASSSRTSPVLSGRASSTRPAPRPAARRVAPSPAASR